MKYDEFVKMNELGSSHWWYAARKALLKHRLQSLNSGLADLRILDLASACGDNFSMCSHFGKVFGVDISSYSIRYCRDKFINTIVQGDAQKLPFKSGSYDIVLALDVFEHLKDDRASLAEIKRVLKEDGTLIFNVPAFMSLYSYHDEAFEHLRRYKSGELREKLNSARLNVDFMTYWSFFIFPLVYIFRKKLNKGENKEKSLSDFHYKVNPFAESILKLLFSIEFFLIKNRIPMPFGVSLFGWAKK